MPRASRRRVLLIAAIGALAAALALLARSSGVLDRQERNTVDARFAVRGDQGPPADVVVVGIEDSTTRALGRWPFPRDVQARIITAVAAAKPRVIGYDIELRDRTTDAADLAILDAIDAAGPIVLATTGVDQNGDADLFIDPASLRDAGIAAGFAAFSDRGAPGAVVRSVPYELEGLASFAVALARVASGRPVPRDGFGDGGAIIDYAGEAGTVRTIPAIDVLRGDASAALRDRVVIIGATDARINDVSRVPVGDLPMPGPEVNANAVATILAGVPLRDAPGWLDALVVVAFAAGGALLGLRRSSWFTLPAVIAAGVLYVVAAQAAFQAGTVLEVVYPLLALLLAGVGASAVNFVAIDRERHRVRAEFARFVPAAVVDDVIASAGTGRRLGGRRLYSTVMFADLREFTTRAEQLPPETVIEVLNRYLTGMSDAVLDHGGTLVSYMGDGIMAIFGAPIEQPDHADRAVDAAREMLRVRLPAFNAWCAGAGHGEPFRMGIGLVSGPVMSGNVGSDRRMEYAAVGDTTNSASRLQGLTKDTPHMVLIADTTRAALTRVAADLVPVGALDMRGKAVPTAVWTLAAPAVPGPGDAAERTVGP
ncbi:MAG: adenylate/guanylate cyclase domain-containing protein [Thermoleophilia bacterium]|nr:adenylate/guanylate cyclase domain-containing protein [Thermoleophilia bacterium]